MAVNTVPGLSFVLAANAMTKNHIWCNQTSAQHACVLQFMLKDLLWFGYVHMKFDEGGPCNQFLLHVT